MSTTTADPISPPLRLVAAGTSEMPHAQGDTLRAFGLSLARRSTSAPTDLSDVTYDPIRQVSIYAGPNRDRTNYDIATHEKTVIDHTSRNDTNQDHRTD